MDSKDDLHTLLPERREVTLRNGDTIFIGELFYGQWPHATKLLLPAMDTVRDTGVIGLNSNGLTFSSDWALKLPQLLAGSGESLIAFTAFAIDKPRKWFDKLPGEDGIRLTRAVFEMNAENFANRILPLLGMAVRPVTAPLDGEKSSPGSSATATDGPTSSDTP